MEGITPKIEDDAGSPCPRCGHPAGAVGPDGHPGPMLCGECRRIDASRCAGQPLDAYSPFRGLRR